MQREIIAEDASCLGKFQSNSGKQWMHNEIFLTLDFSTGATLLLKPGFLQKQGFGCYAPWGDTGLLPRSSDSAGWLQGQFDSSVKNTVGVPRRRAVEIVHGTSSVWREACAVNSHFTHPENPRGTDISKLPPRRVRSLTKACRNARRARRPLCPTGAAECHAFQWPGHLRRSCRGRCCGDRGSRRGTPSSPGRPYPPARRGGRWTPPSPPGTTGCSSAPVPAGRDPATAPDEARRGSPRPHREWPRVPHPFTLKPARRGRRPRWRRSWRTRCGRR